MGNSRLLVVFCLQTILFEGIAARYLLQNACPTKDEFSGRIAFGISAEPGRYPYMVSLRDPFTDRHFCGGVLIAPGKVLTAAHCVDPKSKLASDANPSLAIGGLHLKDDPDIVKRTACRTFIHKSWTSDRVDLGFDIAILELDQTSEKQTIKLMKEGSEPKTESRALGWGLDENEELPDILQELEMDVISMKKCREAKKFDKAVKDGILCAEVAGADVCNGDSGGPLMNPGSGCGENDILIGLTSFGLECSKNKDLESPGAFTYIAQYLPWIEADGARERVVYENPDCDIEPLPEDPTEKIPEPPTPKESKTQEAKPLQKCDGSGICIKLNNDCSEKTIRALVRYKTEKGWTIGGWWTLKPGKSLPVITDAVAGNAYFHAETENGRSHWGEGNPFEFDGKEFEFSKGKLESKYSSYTWHFNCDAGTKTGCGIDRYCVELKNECDIGIRALIRTKEAGKWAIRGWFYVKPGATVSVAKNVEDRNMFIHGESTNGRLTWNGPHTYKFDGEDRGFTKTDMGEDFHNFTWRFICRT